MVDLECEVAIIVPAVFTGEIIIEDPRDLGIWNESEDLPGDSTDATCRNDVSGEWVAGESTGSVRSGCGRIIELDETPVGIP